MIPVFGGLEARVATWRRLLEVGLAGAFGGLVNATLCYAGWPQAIKHADFKWHILPAAFIHGGVLAAVPLAIGVFARDLRGIPRWGIALPVAWVVGYVSWIPLQMSLVGDEPLLAFVWPFTEGGGGFQALWVPIAYFGVVGGLVYAWTVFPSLEGASLGVSVLASSIAGVLGSLWFWALYEYTYFSVIHGVLWGCLVGVAVWHTAARAAGRRTRG